MNRADPRTYITVHDGMPDHPKIMPLSDGAFRLLVTGWCWCSRYLTDGVMPMEVWSRFGNRRHRDELVRVAHVHIAEDGKSVEFHDYLDHQRSRQQVEDLRRKRSEAGRKGGKAGSKTEASASPSAQANEKQNGTIVREQRTDTEVLPSEALSEQPEPRKRGTRLPDDWRPSQDMIARAREDFPSVDLRLETEAFCDWFHAKSGKDATKVDWNVAWRGWIRRTYQRNQERNTQRPARPYYGKDGERKAMF